MATRSAIIVKVGKIYKGIYCHWDGYPSWNGNILQENYNCLERALALVSLGSLSRLSSALEPLKGVIHNFDNRQEGVTVAYHRDRGEPLKIYSGKTIKEVEDGVYDFEYSYLFSNGIWKVRGHEMKGFHNMAKVLEKIKKEER